MATRGWWIALCAEFDLTPAQGHALRSLDPEQPVAMSTLAEALLCDASNVTGIVDKLETRGLISGRAPTTIGGSSSWSSPNPAGACATS